MTGWELKNFKMKSFVLFISGKSMVLFVAITKSDMMDILTNNSPLPRLTFDNGHLRWLETNVIELTGRSLKRMLFISAL